MGEGSPNDSPPLAIQCELMWFMVDRLSDKGVIRAAVVTARWTVANMVTPRDLGTDT